jgi:hypothetical protein
MGRVPTVGGCPLQPLYIGTEQLGENSLSVGIFFDEAVFASFTGTISALEALGSVGRYPDDP